MTETKRGETTRKSVTIEIVKVTAIVAKLKVESITIDLTQTLLGNHHRLIMTKKGTDIRADVTIRKGNHAHPNLRLLRLKSRNE